MKLVPHSESATNDKNIQTVYKQPDRRLRVINQREKRDNVKTSSLGSFELNSEKREISKDVKQLEEDEQTMSSEEAQDSNARQAEAAVADKVKPIRKTIQYTS